MMSDDDIADWREGEKVLTSWLKVNYQSVFKRDGEWVGVYYDEKKGEELHEAIKKFLKDEDNFNEICDDFVKFITKLHAIKAMMIPALIIFDEIDNYPEIASEDIKRRLMRIRKSTHEESYK